STGNEEVYPIWTGTEHAVCFVSDVAATDVAARGEAIRHDTIFRPAGVNVDFVEIVRPGPEENTAVIRVRTFEKGVEAETLACGTGAVASALVAASRHFGRAERVQVQMPGGTLTVGITRNDGRIAELYLQGPAETVYRGSFEYSVG
ncbi:MAG: diaminopimelate epimerase, partial [Rhodothermales bacterium]|nr:diaminopimelate epimerase [Rhodothermales bacterium]